MPRHVARDRLVDPEPARPTWDVLDNRLCGRFLLRTIFDDDFAGPTISLDEYFRAREVAPAKRALIARVTRVDARSDRFRSATSIRRFRRRIAAHGASDGVENLRGRSGA
jgi:hypothetical protein